MSAGDRRHHVHLGERDYDRALRDPRFQALLSRGFAVSYDYDVPYLGGYSRDGATIYIDRDTPSEIKRGKRVYQILQLAPVKAGEPAPAQAGGLIRGILVHEHWEKTAMLAWGFGYAEAHELATHAENHFARDVLGLDPDDYESVWRPVIKLAEKKLHAQAAQLPPDLDLTPYMRK
jgi:hypothetical protein